MRKGTIYRCNHKSIPLLGGCCLSGNYVLIFVCHQNATTQGTIQCSCSKVQLISQAKIAFPFHFCLYQNLKTTLLCEKLDFCYDIPLDSVASKMNNQLI